MPGEQRRAQSAAGIARGRLNPNLVESAFAQNPSVGDAIQRHAARQAEVFHARLLLYVCGHAKMISSVTS